MRALLLLIFVLTFSLPHPAISDAAWTPEMAFKVKRVTMVRVSPDGARVASVVGTAAMEEEKSEWLSQVHVARSDGTGAYPLTRHEKSSTAPEWSPDGQWIAFLSARGKDDKDGVYNALKRQGVTTKMVVYPRQPHGIQEPKLLLDVMSRNLEWFDRHVLGKGIAER